MKEEHTGHQRFAAQVGEARDRINKSIERLRQARTTIAGQFRAECLRVSTQLGIPYNDLAEASIATIIRQQYASAKTEGHHTCFEPPPPDEKK